MLLCVPSPCSETRLNVPQDAKDFTAPGTFVGQALCLRRPLRPPWPPEWIGYFFAKPHAANGPGATFLIGANNISMVADQRRYWRPIKTPGDHPPNRSWDCQGLWRPVIHAQLLDLPFSFRVRRVGIRIATWLSGDCVPVWRSAASWWPARPRPRPKTSSLNRFVRCSRKTA